MFRANIRLMLELFRRGVLKPSSWYEEHGYTLVFEGDEVVNIFAHSKVF